MKNERNFAMIFYLLIGILGPVIIAFGFIRLQFIFDDQFGAIGMMIGFFFVLTYLEFLEKKAGLSAKYRWTRAISSMVLFFVFSFYFYLS